MFIITIHKSQNFVIKSGRRLFIFTHFYDYFSNNEPFKNDEIDDLIAKVVEESERPEFSRQINIPSSITLIESSALENSINAIGQQISNIGFGMGFASPWPDKPSHLIGISCVPAFIATKLCF